METIIDIGNSAIKIAQVDANGQISNITRLSATDFNPQSDLDLPTASAVIIGRSGSHENLKTILAHLNQKNARICLLDKNAKLPFISHYTPGQAGIDRLANVAAAIATSPGPAIIVDAGSAITLEVISPEQVFLGGAIFPGIRLQAQSLKSNTADLPRIFDSTTIAPPVATDTVSAIRAGITHGIAGAINHLLNLAAAQLDNSSPHLIITGGDAQMLSHLLPHIKFSHIPELTLRGLYLLAKY